jgi:hypothetical protein
MILRPKQARFVEEYLIDLNAAQGGHPGRLQRQDSRRDRI